MTRKERLREVYEYVRSHFPVHSQSDFAAALKYNRAYISSAMNGNEKILLTNYSPTSANVFRTHSISTTFLMAMETFLMLLNTPIMIE